MKRVVFCAVLLLAAHSNAATNEHLADPAPQDWAGSTVSQAGTRGRTQELKPGGAEAWGLPKEGFLLGIRMDKDEFTNGEPVTATITLRNVSHKELKHWESRSGDQMTRFLLSKDGEKIKGYFDPMDNTFAERLKSARAGSKTTCADPVGTERVFSHEISKLYPLTNGTYWIRAKRSDLINEELTDTLSIESGDYTFKILGSSEQRAAPK